MALVGRQDAIKEKSKMLSATKEYVSDRAPMRPARRTARTTGASEASPMFESPDSSPPCRDKNSLTCEYVVRNHDVGGGMTTANANSSFLDFVPTLPHRVLSPMPRSKGTGRRTSRNLFVSPPTQTVPATMARSKSGNQDCKPRRGHSGYSPGWTSPPNLLSNDGVGFKVDLTPNQPTRFRSPYVAKKKQVSACSFPPSPPLFLSTYDGNDIPVGETTDKYGYESACPDIQERNEERQAEENSGVLVTRFHSFCKIQMDSQHKNIHCRGGGEVHQRRVFEDDDNSSVSSSSISSMSAGELSGDREYDRQSGVPSLHGARMRRSNSQDGDFLFDTLASTAPTTSLNIPQSSSSQKRARRSSLKNSDHSLSQQRENFLRETFRRRSSSGTSTEDDFIQVNVGQSPRKRRRSITFSKEEEVAVITPAIDLAQSKSDLYLQQDDYKRIKYDIFQLTKRIKKLEKLKQHGRRLSDTAIDYSYCVRGLEEVISRDTHRSSQLQYVLATKTVFEKQKQTLDMERKNDASNDEEALARLYCQVTAISKREAMVRARRDELDALSPTQKQQKSQHKWHQEPMFGGKPFGINTNGKQPQSSPSQGLPRMMTRRGSCYV